MDSNDDNQYKLLIDTVNNNRSDKSYSSANLSAISECSLFPLTLLSANNSRSENHGSARRKCATLFKGITIEEFLESDDDPYSLTAIDKLILKNKAALAEDQMKKGRGGGTSKSSTKETAAPTLQPVSVAGNKKQATANGGSKKPLKKILGSKIANKRKNNVGESKKAVVNDKCNGVAKTNGVGNGAMGGGGKTKFANVTTALANKESKKSKPVTLSSVPLKKESFKSRNSVDNVPVKEPQNQSLQRTQQQLPQQQLQRIQRQQLRHQQNKQQRSPKKQQPQKKGSVTEVRRMLQSNRRVGRVQLKKSSKQSTTKKSLELIRLKTSLSYQTRSGNKERLRNGKSWIFRETESPTPPKSKKSKRFLMLASSSRLPSASELSAAPVVTSANPLKRIKQEPIDVAEGTEVCEKRRKLVEIKVESNNNNDATKVADAARLKTSSIEEAVCQQAYEIKPIECVPSKTVTAPPAPLSPSNPPAVKDELENSMKEEIMDDFLMDDEADEIDISFITNLLAASDRVSSSLKNDMSSDDDNDDDVKSETISSQTDKQTETNTLVNGDINSKKIVLSNTNVDLADSIRTIVTVPLNGKSQLEPIAEVSNTNSFLSESNNQLNHENNLSKESMFNALGLQCINRVYESPKECEIKDKENYTGTLRAVIKTDKGCRRMEMKQKDDSSNLENLTKENIVSPSVTNCSTDKFNKSTTSSDSVNNSIDDMEPLCIEDNTSKNLQPPLLSSIRDAEPVDKLSECNLLVESIKDKNKIVEPLVVPEKSSSFSIHPDRLCSDVCKYCFGKFGSLDTPCHVAQLKNNERQRKILLCEPNLKMDTCLCDACFRYVDRKANRPPKRKPNRRNAINQRTMCAVQNCSQVARHYGKRKWRLRMGKKIPNLCVDVTKSGSRVAFGLCSQHFCMVEPFPSCGICKKRVKRKELTSIRSEVNEVNEILRQDGIPVKLTDNAFLCKFCHNCITLRKKYGNSCNMSPNNRQYYQNFQNEILRLNNVVEHAAEDSDESTNSAKENRGTDSSSSNLSHDTVTSPLVQDTSRIKDAHSVGIGEIASLLKPLEADHSNDKTSTHIQLKFGNLNIGKLSNLNIGQNAPAAPAPVSAVAESKTNNDKSAPLGDKELPLVADFKFETAENVPRTWEKCVSTILFDKSVKKLWQDLQQPYGNQSSFIRHLIMLEKFWRSGALVLAENAEPSAVKYINSVKNRVESLGSTTPPKLTVATAAANPVTSSTASRTTLSPSPAKVAPSSAISMALPKPESSIRHASTPPPLLKLGSYSMPMVARCNSKPSHPIPAAAVRTLPGNVSLVAVKYSSSGGVRSTPTPSPPPLTCMPPPPPPPPLQPQHHQQQHLPPPPLLEKISNRYGVNRMGMTLNQFKEMMESQSRQRGMQRQFSIRGINEFTVPSSSSVPVQKKASVCASAVNGNSTMRSSTVAVNFPSRQYASPLMKRSIDPVPYSAAAPPSTLIAKLPKALTVTQISETTSSNRRLEAKPSAMAAPFLVGEKPSVSVFREFTKN